MATLEKPKTKKKRKTRSSGESVGRVETRIADVELLEDQVEDPEELEVAPIVEEVQGIAEECHHPTALATEPTTQKQENEVAKTQERPLAPPAEEEAPEEVIVTPSAPPLEVEEVPQVPILRETSTQLYPTLEKLKQDAIPFMRTQDVQGLEINIEPFTIAQLRELYSNNLLCFAKDLEKEFIETELNPSFLRNDDFLFHCLQEYMQALAERRCLEIEAERLKEICKGNQEKLWSIINVNQRFSGTCSDGNRVSTTVSFKKAIFNDNVLELVFGNLSEIRTACCDKFVNCATLGALFKMMIDEEIVRIQNQHSSAAGQEFVSGSDDLRRSISVLFFFLRKPSVDKIFTSNVKKWLTIVVNLLLEVATWPDHMFILHHVLRCPPGVVSWAAPMIQVPASGFSTESLENHVCIQHSLTILQAILLPVTKRLEFLSEILCWSRMDKNVSGGDEWSFVDSDGEEDVDLLVLRESDLVAIFNQIPWREIFSLATKMEPQAEGYIIRKEAITARTVLQFFAFASFLVETLGIGLCTYNTEKYRQFTKRLARLVAQCVQYASSVYNVFQGATVVNDVMIRARIQTEFEQLLVRSVDHIYLSRTAGAWQYLVGLPFDQLTPQCIGNLYQKIRAPHFGDSPAEETIEARNREADYSIVEVFEANDVSQEDLHYLLQTLANMASVNVVLRQSIVSDFLEIGFLRGSTKHDCSKIARDLIANLAEECPELISDIILQFEGNSLEGSSYGTYLLKRLPLQKWRPGPGVLDTLEKWLLESSLESAENGMARIIINNINWGYLPDGRLFLHAALHTRIALIIFRAAVKNSSSSSNFIAENVKSLVMDKTTALNFQTWCWKMISVLKLHAIDRETPWQVICTPEAVLSEIPELEDLADVCKGIKENRHLAIYLSILLTQRGHSIPQICTYSFRNMEVLFKSDDQVTALRCLQIVFPLFLACPESLSKNTAFNSLLHHIFSVDNSYARMTIDMVFSKSVCAIIELFGKMILSQFMEYQRYGLRSPTAIILLWLQCLTRYKDFKSNWNALYILDVILEFAFTVPEAWFEARQLFASLTMETKITATPAKSMSSFLSKSTSIGLIPNLPVTTIWLGLLVFDVQFDVFEAETGFWQEFVLQLSLQSSAERNLDSLVRKVASSVGSQHSQSSDLVFCKLANLIISCPTSHTMLVILCQRFFALYLTKVSSSQGHVRDRLYYANEMIMKRVRGQLEHAQVYHEQLADSEGEFDEVLHRFHGSVAEMFRTYQKWLEGKDITQDSRVRRLLFSRQDWTEFINMSSILSVQKQNYEEWNAKIGRQIPRCSVTVPKSDSRDFTQKIEKQLMSYDTPVPRRSQELVKSVINVSSAREYLQSSMFSSSQFKSDFNLMEKYAKTYATDIKELCQLDTVFGRLVKGKLVNEQVVYYRSQTCSNLLGNKDCSGSASIRITENRVNVVADVERKIASNREKSESLMNTMRKPLQDDVLRALLRMEQTLRKLMEKSRHVKCTESCKIAFEILYKTLRSSSDFLTLYPPTKSLTQSVVKSLAHFMSEHLQQEGQRLVEIMLKGAFYADLLMDLFTPEKLPTREFLTIYEITIASFGNWNDQEIIAMILGRISVADWLQMQEPHSSAREGLMQLILRGLKVGNHRNSVVNDQILRSHLIQLFRHHFPQSYNSVLKSLFEGFTKLGITADVLMDLMSVLCNIAGLGVIKPSASGSEILEMLERFSREQKILSQVDLMETIHWLSAFFKEERKKVGIYGLFTTFKDLYRVFNVFMSTVLQAATLATVQAFPGATADQYSEWIWPCIRDVYEMWLIPIVLDGGKAESSTNWLKNQVDVVNPVLLPWSDSTKVGPDEVLDGFTRCTIFALSSIPGSNSMLEHIFMWYEKNFTNALIPSFITLAIHGALKKLPWGNYDPSVEVLTMSSRIFSQKRSEASMIFVSETLMQVSWTSWLQKHQPAWNYVERVQTISLLFSLFVSMAAYCQRMTSLLQEVEATFPWDLVENSAYSDTLGVFSLAAGSTWCVKLAANLPTGSLEKAVWNLLRRVSRIDLSGEEAKSTKAAGKRLVYVKTILQFLVMSVNNNKEFFTSNDGQKIFQGIFSELLKDVQKILEKEEDFPKEGLNVLVEMVRNIPQEAESSASKLVMAGFASWQINNSSAGPSLLHAISMSRKASEPLSSLLEVTIEGCFRNSSVEMNTGWKFVQETMWSYMAMMRPALIGQEALHCLHLYASMTFRSERDARKRLTLMGVVFERLNGARVTEENELKVVLLWGFLCCVSFRECDQSPENSVFLVHVTRRLIHMANEPDDWGKSVLNAIGITRLKRSKVLWKCLACHMAELLKVISIECDFERERCALNVELQSKQFNPYREAISEINLQSCGDLSHLASNIASLLRRFYDTDGVLQEVETMWS
ncbi:ectopic P granules protein 5 homolog [Phlebotomus argentipes]|uniref:ectopic P granules protein 5 homolog n=1 Tax=Phlebotomus argentipes TaxID=94469 RepID=UPI0028930F79|nr:ectopic P granules protein 5 homolog [Phlebotomus argentipes]